MRKGTFWHLLIVLWVFGVSGGPLLAQQPAPDTILYNGKVVTVDNHEVNGNLGTIAQAIAIREGKIMAVGSNDPIRQMAGPNTKSYDLKGRTVTPGFGATHDHPQDWNPLNPTIMKKVVSDDMHIERFLNVPPDQVMQQFPRVLDEAVQKAKPGQWIRISLLYGPDYRWGNEISPMLGRQINKQLLDVTAPNNPVLIRGGFTGLVLNQKGIEAVKNGYGDQWDKFLINPIGSYTGESGEETGTCGVCYREVEQDILYPPEVLREIYRLGLSWTSALGVTLNATSLYTGGAIRAFNSLDKEGQMAMRLGWGWFWPERNDFFQDPYFVNAVASLVGKGSDYLWNTGMTAHQGGQCTKLEPLTPEAAARKERNCANPGYSQENISRALYEYLKVGGRIAGDHMMGDVEIDMVLDIIEKAARDAGMTLDDIRSKRHVTEHMTLYPRPDQIPRFKKLGIVTSGWDIVVWQGTVTQILRDYGERGAMNMVPRKALYDAGIMNSVEIDRPLSEYTNLTYMHVLYGAITRKDWDGNLVAPAQAISREAMLKSATLFAAYGTLKEDVLGSLEPGKFADLVVLDKDYLTIPVDDILTIRVLMTMVGGTPMHLVPSLAREWGMQPTGAQVELGGPAAQW